MVQSPTAVALALPREDRAAAVNLLIDAGARGDVEALMQLVVWHLLGDGITRDLKQARTFLRRAVSIGHVDGALMEIALTANGSGGDRDWALALQLLKTAAVGDPVAAGQLALIQAMALNGDGRPTLMPSGRAMNDKPAIRHFPQLLTPDECAHVADVGRAVLEPSAILDPATGRPVQHPIRTSSGGAIGPALEDLVIRAINLRIAAISNTDVHQGEALTVLHYAPGQQYRLHHDMIAGADNQRLRTVLVYLNEAYAGGETVFPDLNIRFRGKPGDALMFDNIDADGRPFSRARHAGLPITAGAKWLATRWIRVAPIDLWQPS